MGKPFKRASAPADPGRRRFLGGAAALGCSAAAWPLITPVTLAAAPGENRLVVIVLRGALDGLDAVRPAFEPALARMRPTIIQGSELKDGDLDGRWALHPALLPLRALWQEGSFGAVHATSTPYRDKRSHFDGQDILETGTPGIPPSATERRGWLNRALEAMPGVTPTTAFAVGREDLLILEGPAPHASWSPDLALGLTPQAALLLERLYAGDPLFAEAARQALMLAEAGTGLAADAPEDGEGEPNMMMEDPAAALRKSLGKAGRASRGRMLAAFAAERLNAETRIAAFSLGGFDTHRGQHGTLRRALAELAEAITTLRATLGPNWERTAVLCMTEFGRTAAENGTRGTDHGTGGALLYAGGALRGGRVLGRWPGLEEADLYAGRDLMPTSDLRLWAGWVLHALFGLERGVIESAVFPRLDMGTREPGLVV
ncbi:MAG: DUF1501 domain-containing protein [Alphaproteobacteria bacterium]|nr:MAG: DUF1501 domain-containing protein [Alphaproteobacteria bacterium]